jgi:predicted Zn-dependent protease
MVRFRILVVAALLTLGTALAQFPGLDRVIPKPPIPIPAPSKAPSKPAVPNLPVDVPVDGLKDMVRGAAGVPIESELAIGGALAVEIVGRHGGIVKDEAMNRRVALIGKTLGMYSTRPDLPWRFGILDSKEVNAVSAPGGYVFITRGLYEKVNSDDELAGVLGHEISHVARRHALRIISRNQFVKGLVAVGSYAGAQAGGPDLRGLDEGIGEITTTLLDKGYDPGIEYDADRAGRQLAYDAGYDPDGLVAFLRRLASQNPSKSYAFSTHPPLNNRVSKLQAN